MPQATRATTRPARLAALNARRPDRGKPGAPTKPARKSPWADITPARQEVRNTKRATLEAAGFAFDDRGFGLDVLGLGRFPNEVLDILFSRNELNLRDHLALGATCHAIRAMYTDEVWEALLAHRPMPVGGQHQKIDCHDDCVCERVLRTMATAEGGHTEHILVIGYDGVPQTPKDQAISLVHDPERSLTQSQARRIYAVSISELRSLKECRIVTVEGKITKYYLESAVEAIALRQHGGYRGHFAYVQNLHDRRVGDSNKRPPHRRKVRLPRAYGQEIVFAPARA